jgi:trehalose 2-sulfotransferase
LASTYAICASPRSGSSLLCDLLEQAGVLGRPEEFFNPDSFRRPFLERHGLGELAVDEYLEQLRAEFTTPNGVFGMKLMPVHVQELLRSPRLHGELRDWRYVWLRRDDVVGQAVSWYVAAETGEWDLVEKEPSGASVAYDREQIAGYLDQINADSSAWTEFFAVNRLDFLVVRYEDLLEDANAACRRICAFCGVETDHEFALERSWFRRQRNGLGEELVRRFAAESRLKIDGAAAAGAVAAESEGLLLCEQ